MKEKDKENIIEIPKKKVSKIKTSPFTFLETNIKTKRYLVLCRKINETHHKVKTIQIKSSHQKTVSTGQNTYQVNLKKPNYIDKFKHYYFHDIDTGSPIPFTDYKGVISDPQVLNTLLKDKIVREAVLGMGEKPPELKTYIVGGIVGASLAAFIFLLLIYLEVL